LFLYTTHHCFFIQFTDTVFSHLSTMPRGSCTYCGITTSFPIEYNLSGKPSKWCSTACQCPNAENARRQKVAKAADAQANFDAEQQTASEQAIVDMIAVERAAAEQTASEQAIVDMISAERAAADSAAAKRANAERAATEQSNEYNHRDNHHGYSDNYYNCGYGGGYSYYRDRDRPSDLRDVLNRNRNISNDRPSSRNR
jgi:hypothetical protein